MSKKLCLGTFLTILSQAKRNTQKVLIAYALSVFGPATEYADDSNQAHYKSGKMNLTGFDQLISYDKTRLVNHFREKVVPELKPDLLENIVLAFKDVLKEDDIPDLTPVGYENGYTKQDIVGKYHFDFPELLANLFYYCVVQIPNQSPYKNNIKEIGPDYLRSFDSSRGLVALEEKTTPVTATVSQTARSDVFDSTFREVFSKPLSIPNSNALKIYALDITNSQINYVEIKKFIRRNIGRYVLSRAQRSNYELRGDAEMISAAAINAYKKRMQKNPETNHFNEIMLYSFLECVLGAPKLFSKMELQNKSGEVETFSSGIHILFLRNGMTPFNQVVLGASDTDESLTGAIDHAFEQVGKIASGASEDYQLVESSVYDKAFDNETNEALENVILPKKGTSASKPEKAYGLFLGYSIRVQDDWLLTNEEFVREAEQKMKSDIEGAATYIERKIAEAGLANHSFYIYVLPLNEATKDKESIIGDALFPEGDD